MTKTEAAKLSRVDLIREAYHRGWVRYIMEDGGWWWYQHSTTNRVTQIAAHDTLLLTMPDRIVEEVRERLVTKP